MKKNYIIDTSVLLDDPNCMTILRNGEENEIYIPYTVILELDHLKSDKRLSYNVSIVTEKMEALKFLQIMKPYERRSEDFGDLQIIQEVKKSNISEPIIVTNDRLFRILCVSHNITAQEY